MNRLIWYGGSDFRLHSSNSALPSPAPGEVLISVRAVGICGTDIHIIEGRFASARPPLILGHEIAGIVQEVGHGVTRVRAGDRVTVDQVIGCGTCPQCLRGAQQFCPQSVELGFTRDGGCQDFLILPESNVYLLPDHISLEEAAVLDMEVWGALRKCTVNEGDTVLVIGHGSAGLVACQVARAFGAGKVILAGDTLARLVAAERISVADRYVRGTGQVLLNAVHAETDGLGVDVVFECAGTPVSVDSALATARCGGRVVLYGVQRSLVEQFDVNRIVLKDLVVFGATSDRLGWQEVINLVSSGRLRLLPLITHRFPLEQAPEAYDLVRRRADGVLKAVVTLAPLDEGMARAGSLRQNNHSSGRSIVRGKKTMRIRLRRVSVEMIEPLRISNGVADHRDSVVVEIERNGVSGFGEAAPMPGAFYSPQTPESSWEQLAHTLAPALLQWDGALDRRSLDGSLQELLESKSDDPFARAGIEGACWDLICRELRQPLQQAIGSTPRPIPSGTGVGICDTIDELLYRVGACMDQGYLRMKIKIQPGWDIEPVEAIRNRFGDIPLMVDANAAYTLADAPVLRELGRFGLLMLEQPLAASAIEDLAELQRGLRTPVCVDESADSLAALNEVIRLNAARILNIKVQRVGGIHRARAMYQRAVEAGLGCWVGTMPELGIASAQALHLATLPGFSEATDVGPSTRWYATDIVDPLITISGGHIHLPSGDGNGFQINRGNLERYSTESVELL